MPALECSRASEGMNESPANASLEVLLDRLNQGDVAAAEKLFLIYEPYLRLLVRRRLGTHLRSKFDSIDIVQSVWADLLAGFRANDWQFADPTHLQAFLVKVTRNRFIDRLRHHRRALSHEQSLASAPVESLPATPQAGPRSAP